jgi:hypothetical protein
LRGSPDIAPAYASLVPVEEGLVKLVEDPVSHPKILDHALRGPLHLTLAHKFRSDGPCCRRHNSAEPRTIIFINHSENFQRRFKIRGFIRVVISMRRGLHLLQRVVILAHLSINTPNLNGVDNEDDLDHQDAADHHNGDVLRLPSGLTFASGFRASNRGRGSQLACHDSARISV